MMEKKGITKRSKRAFKRLDEFRINKLPEQALTPALFILGVFGTRQLILYLNANKRVEKVAGLAGLSPETVTGLAATLGGLTIAQLANDQKFQVLGWGVAATGMALTAKAIWNKDFLSGINDKTVLPEMEKENHYLVEGPGDSLKLDLDQMDEAMQLIENSVQESDDEVEGLNEQSSHLRDLEDQQKPEDFEQEEDEDEPEEYY